MTTALFIGRFQPVHTGHEHVIQRLQDEYEVVVGIGSANEDGTFDNPLTADERSRLLESCFNGIETVQIPDFNDGDRWMDYIEDNVAFDRCVSGNPYVQLLFKQRGHTVKAPELVDPDRYSGTLIRVKVAMGLDWQDRVPDPVAELLQEWAFEQRVRDIVQNA